MRAMRTILAFLIAPIFPGVLVVLAPAILGAAKPSELVWIVELAAALGYPIAALLGIPAFLLLRWRRWNGILSYSIAGAGLGLLIYIVYLPLGHFYSAGFSGAMDTFLRTAPVFLPLGVMCGTVAASVFWAIARPDRQIG